MAQSIRIGICEWSLPIDGPLGFSAAAEAGFSGLQIDVGRGHRGFPMSRPYVRQLYQDEARRHGLQFTSIAVRELDDTSMFAPEGTRERQIVDNAIIKAIDAASAMDIPIVMIPQFLASDIDSAEKLEQAADIYRKVCDYAHPKGITVATENILSADEMEQLYGKVDRPNFKLYFDSQNYWLNKGYNQPEMLERLMPMICEIHLKDGKDGVLSGSLLGEGDSDFFRTMEVIRESGYSGWLVLENYYDQEPLCLQDENPVSLMKKDVETLKKLLGN